MQWREYPEGKFTSGFMVPFASSQTLQFFSLQTLFYFLSPLVQKGDSDQQDFCVYQGEEYLVSDF